MGIGGKSVGFLLALFVVLTVVHRGESKKTIKIHVPYYVKHIHHYKKVFVPKVQVIKHEHHHKKEHDHHHHHHEYKHSHDHDHDHYHSYEKIGHGYEDDSSRYDNYYDEIDSRNFGGDKHPLRRGKLGYRGNPQYKGWKDVDGSEYRGEDSTEEEEGEDYTEVREVPFGKGRPRSKSSPSFVIPVYRKKSPSVRRSDDSSSESSAASEAE